MSPRMARTGGPNPLLRAACEGPGEPFTTRNGWGSVLSGLRWAVAGPGSLRGAVGGECYKLGDSPANLLINQGIMLLS
jgi:hypothetical protein